MSWSSFPLAGALALAVASAGCGGGGSSSPSGASSVPAGTPETVVAAYDFDADGDADVLTLDTGARPMRIVSALEGAATGDLIPAPTAAGAPIDAGISDAIAAYLAGSFAIGAATEIEARDSAGNLVTVTIYE